MVWIPEGTYTVGFTHYETCKSWNGVKLHAYFGVTEGEYAGIPLPRFYNVDALVSPPGLNGEFQVSAGRLLVREHRALLPDLASQGVVDLMAYEGKLIRAKVVTVGKDGLGQELADPNRYSAIRKLIEIIPDHYDVLS